MKVLLNDLTALRPQTGVGRYTAQLARALAAQLPADEFATYPPPSLRRLAAAGLRRLHSGGPQGKASSLRGTIRRRGTHLLKLAGKAATAAHFSRYCRVHGVELYHEPNFLPLETPVPTVVTIHDLSTMLHPEWHPADRVREHGRHLNRAVQRAAHLITPTEQVRREVIAHLGAEASRVTAVPHGIGPELRVPSSGEIACWRGTFDLPERFFLCVGTIEPRKNIRVALEAFVALPVTVRERCPLVLAGPWGWKAETDYEFFQRVAKPAGARHLGFVPDAALPALYASSTLLYPSFYEGFGLPPLEAIACGGTAICSRGTAAVREVMGSTSAYVEAADVAGWRAAMLTATDADWRRGFHERARPHVRRFTWEQAADATRGVYDHVLGRTVSRSRAA